MREETSNEYFESVLGLEQDWQVSRVSVDEFSFEIVFDLSRGLRPKVASPECVRACPTNDHRHRRECYSLDMLQLKWVFRAPVSSANGPQTVLVPCADPMRRFFLVFEENAIDVEENVWCNTQACDLSKIGWVDAERIMARAVARGRNRRRRQDLVIVGTDEKGLLKGHRYNITGIRYESFRDIEDAALKALRAWFSKGETSRFFRGGPKTASGGEEHFREWSMHSNYRKLEPLKKGARMLKEILGNVVSWSRHSIANAVSEGLNGKIQSTKSAARCFHSFASHRILFLFSELDLKPGLVQSI